MLNSQHIQVYLRFRPLSKSELSSKDPKIWLTTKNCVSLSPEIAGTLMTSRRHSAQKSYSFQHCFTESDGNHSVYTRAIKGMIRRTFEGYSCSVFAYGQTGSGKTYTMTGQLSHTKGLIHYALEDIFSSEQANSFQIECSYVEIYNENIYDLLAEGQRIGTPLVVAEDREGFHIKNVSKHEISDIDTVISLYTIGEKNRTYACTSLNHKSSRSHALFKIDIFQKGVYLSSLNFVDLAGNERISARDSSRPRSVSPLRGSRRGDTNEEGKNINVSLFYLCQVIYRLSEGRSERHIPYRNSNLTKLLKRSLASNSLNCIICTATPSKSQFELTLSTLKFGGVASSIRTQVIPNTGAGHEELIRQIEALKHKLHVAKLENATFEQVHREKNSLEYDNKALKKKIQVLQDCVVNLKADLKQSLSHPLNRNCEDLSESELKELQNHYINGIDAINRAMANRKGGIVNLQRKHSEGDSIWEMLGLATKETKENSSRNQNILLS